MHSKITGVGLSGLLVLAVGAVGRVGAADAKAAAKVNYQEHVSTIFKNRCNSCHNADKQKGGLNLEDYGSTMRGGGSGAVVEPGDLEASPLWLQVTHKDEPVMPPNSPKLPDAELEVIKGWIEAGAPETSGSVVAVKAKPKFEFKLDPSAMGKPAGPAAMPENLPTEPVVVSARPTAIVAMANSPWAPLVAVAGHKQVLLYGTNGHRLNGVLPFPEGTIHVLKFSRNGALLLAGGGRGGQSGLAVVWDVKTGKRVFEIGKEYDAVLAADISPDHGQVALGGPSKIVRVYSTADGQLQFERKKHTDWITAIEFSPDGVLLASGDRSNGLVVWESFTGREYFDLRGHTLAITDVSWRLDSNVVASASEDGTVRLWEMENGTQVRSIAAHGGGAASARFAKDGRLVTSGRDRVVRLWGQDGAKQRDFEPFGDLALEAVFNHDETEVIAGDWSGEVRVWNAKDGTRIANLAANPGPVATRLEQARQAIAAMQDTADAARKELILAQEAANPPAAALTRAQLALTAAQQAIAQQTKAAADAESLANARTAAAKAAVDAVAAARSLAEKAAAAKTAAEKGSITTAVAEAQALIKASADALTGAQAAAAKIEAARAEPSKALADARLAAQAATTLAAASKAEVEKATASKLAADTAVAAKKAAVDAAVTKLKGLKEESESLAAEKKASDAARSAMTASGEKKS